ncbi:MAG TPA: hypothetical protein VMJ11_20115 [Paraburkholderia sp.]|uniref:hypothetical protein n=1 Tax=Paraburkholderia sp. TaxID=1926495 RepID=UPI002CEDCF44|nr:hypothetical protein [Paraburkholderia sp.]HTR08911.1 hypothetical protein [Paraburkholderia sp.]
MDTLWRRGAGLDLAVEAGIAPVVLPWQTPFYHVATATRCRARLQSPSGLPTPRPASPSCHSQHIRCFHYLDCSLQAATPLYDAAQKARKLTAIDTPDQTFKQIVLFGVKRRADGVDSALATRLARITEGELPPELPEHWTAAPYCIPSTAGEHAFMSTRIDAPQLEHELERLQGATLWPQFATTFASKAVVPRRPLRDLSDWHLALALAAGQITGVVTGTDGTRLLIRGDTIKQKEQEVQVEETDKGDIRTTILMRDRFVPTIAGIDFTPGPNLGRIVTIR